MYHNPDVIQPPRWETLRDLEEEQYWMILAWGKHHSDMPLARIEALDDRREQIQRHHWEALSKLEEQEGEMVSAMQLHPGGYCSGTNGGGGGASGG